MASMKGMLLSERPGAGAGATIDPSPVTGPAVNIGNFKGIMLSNRPFAGVAAASRPKAGGAKQAFVTGIPPVAVGINSTVQREPHAVVNRSKKHTALSRHKQWLHDLQKTKDRLQAELEEEEERQERKHKRFIAREAKMRAAVRGVNATTDPVERKEAAEALAGASKPPSREATQAAEAAAAASAAIAAEVRGSSGAGSAASGAEETRLAEEKVAAAAAYSAASAAAAAAAEAAEAKPSLSNQRLAEKPMWALTEEDAAALAEQREDDEAKQLLDFAANLDFESYMDDLEMRAVLERMRVLVEAQSAVLEGEEDGEHGEDGEAQAKSVGALTAANLAASKAAGGGSGAPEDDVASVAKSVLSEGGRSVRSVHSHKSITAIAERAKTRMQQAKKMAPVHEHAPGAKVVAPRVVVHNEEAERLTGKNPVSNLPYMHRNPAI